MAKSSLLCSPIPIMVLVTLAGRLRLLALPSTQLPGTWGARGCERCATLQGSYECRQRGIYPRQDLGSPLSFSQHSYSERQTERESWNEGKDSGGETLSFSVRVPNNPFLMKSLPSCPWTQSSGSQSSSPFTSCSCLSTFCSYSLLTDERGNRGNTTASHIKNMLSKV